MIIEVSDDTLNRWMTENLKVLGWLQVGINSFQCAHLPWQLLHFSQKLPWFQWIEPIIQHQLPQQCIQGLYLGLVYKELFQSWFLVECHLLLRWILLFHTHVQADEQSRFHLPYTSQMIWAWKWCSGVKGDKVNYNLFLWSKLILSIHLGNGW